MTDGITQSCESLHVNDQVQIHRIGGANIENLSLKSDEAALMPPGISVLRSISPADAGEEMRRQFPRVAPRGMTVVASTTVGEVRKVGFDVIMNPTRRFPQHK